MIFTHTLDAMLFEYRLRTETPEGCYLRGKINGRQLLGTSDHNHIFFFFFFISSQQDDEEETNTIAIK